jgi:hypothetical protein
MRMAKRLDTTTMSPIPMMTKNTGVNAQEPVAASEQTNHNISAARSLAQKSQYATFVKILTEAHRITIISLRTKTSPLA